MFVWCNIYLRSFPQAHCHYVALKAFYSATQSSGLGRENLAILQALCSLFATFGITQNAGEFMLVRVCVV